MPELMDDVRAMIVEQLAKLETYEQHIKKHFNTFMEVGQAFAQIKAQKLYLAKSRTWELYLNDHWTGLISLTRADRIVKAWQVHNTLETGGVKVKHISRRAAQKLSGLARTLQIPAMEQAIAEARARGAETPTTEEVETAVEEQEKKLAAEEPIAAIRLAAKDFKELQTLAETLHNRCEQLAHAKWGAELTTHMPEIRAAANTIKERLKWAAPYSECVYCGQKKKCEVCRGRGWMSRAMYRNAPKSVQEKVKDHA